VTAPIDVLVDRAHGHRAPGATKFRRVVMRLHPADLARVDALRPRFKVPRSAILRALLMAGLSMAEEQTATPKDGAT
jgi:hypothetical protein